MTSDIEIHVGLPAGVVPPKEIPQLRWKSVSWTVHGSQARDRYPGHRVDGELAAIGTVNVSSVEEASLFLADFGDLAWPAGARLEIERVVAAASVARDAERAALLAAVPSRWTRVPAPRFERHMRLPLELIQTYDRNGALACLAFFEVTAFVGRQDVVVTFVGESLEDVVDARSRLASAVVEVDFDLAPAEDEEVLGAWQPAAWREGSRA